MPGLVLEGGTFRPVFSCGVMDALLDNNVMFDYVIGVSAGITYAVSYVSRQRGRNIEVLRRYRRDKRYLGARNLPRDRSIFGVEFVFSTIPNELIPFDWDTYHQYTGRIRVGVTNARTGAAEYLDGAQLDRPSTMLRATCAIPIHFPPVHIGGEVYYDGGLADPIPIVRSLHDGNKKNLIVLTSQSTTARKCSTAHCLPRACCTANTRRSRAPCSPAPSGITTRCASATSWRKSSRRTLCCFSPPTTSRALKKM